MFRWFALLTVFTFLLSCGGGGDSSGGDETPPPTGGSVGGGSTGGSGPRLVNLVVTTETGETLVPVGTETTMRARAHYDDDTTVDVTDEVEWSSVSATVEESSSDGIFRGLVAGPALVQGELDGKTYSIDMYVADDSLDVDSLHIFVSHGSNLPVGVQGKIEASLHLRDGTSVDVSDAVEFSSAYPNILDISDTGFYVTVGTGLTSVSAKYTYSSGGSNMWDPLESTCRHASLSIL